MPLTSIVARDPHIMDQSPWSLSTSTTSAFLGVSGPTRLLSDFSLLMVVNLIYHNSSTRGILTRTSFCLWEISTLLRICLFFSIRFLSHWTKGDSIVSELYHMRCYILMGVFSIQRLDHDYLFLTLFLVSIICLGLFQTVGIRKDSLTKITTLNGYLLSA